MAYSRSRHGSGPLLRTGWLLHSQRFRENSLLATFLTAEGGATRAVVHSGSGSRRQFAGYPQPFHRYHFKQYGSSDLKTVSGLESGGAAFVLHGPSALAGLYFNELLYRLLPAEEPADELYSMYEEAIVALGKHRRDETIADFAAADPLLWQLRDFEHSLTHSLGLHPGFELDYSGSAIRQEEHYLFNPDAGWQPTASQQDPVIRSSPLSASGALLQACARHDWQQSGTLGLARRLASIVIDRALDGRQVMARALISQAAQAASRRRRALDHKGRQVQPSDRDNRTE